MKGTSIRCGGSASDRGSSASVVRRVWPAHVVGAGRRALRVTYTRALPLSSGSICLTARTLQPSGACTSSWSHRMCLSSSSLPAACTRYAVMAPERAINNTHAVPSAAAPDHTRALVSGLPSWLATAAQLSNWAACSCRRGMLNRPSPEPAVVLTATMISVSLSAIAWHTVGMPCTGRARLVVPTSAWLMWSAPLAATIWICPAVVCTWPAMHQMPWSVLGIG